MALSNCSGSHGFIRNRSAPADAASSRTRWSPEAERMMTGIPLVAKVVAVHQATVFVVIDDEHPFASHGMRT